MRVRVRRVAFVEVARERLAEVGAAVVRRAARVREVDLEQLGFALDQHRHRAGALRLLAGAAALVLGDVAADDDRQAVAARRTPRSAAQP